MGSGKRKRTSSPGTGATPEADATRGSKKSKPSGTRDKDTKDTNRTVKIVYELVGSNKTYSRDADSRSLDKVATKVAQRLGVSFLGLQMFHVRPGGIEAPLWDNFDFDALKARAARNKSKREVIRVYSAGSKIPAASSAPATAAPTPEQPRRAASVPNAVGTPRSALRAPGSNTPRSEKRVVLALPGDSPPASPSPAPTTPTPHSSSASSGKSKARRRRKRGSMENSRGVSPQDNNQSSPEPTAVTASPIPHAGPSTSPVTVKDPRRLEIAKREAANIAKREAAAMFKPANPSPLSQATTADLSDDEPPTKKKKKGTSSSDSPAKTATPTKSPATKKAATTMSPASENAKSPASGARPVAAKKSKRQSRVSDLPPVYGDIPPVVGSLPPSEDSGSISQQAAEETEGNVSEATASGARNAASFDTSSPAPSTPSRPTAVRPSTPMTKTQLKILELRERQAQEAAEKAASPSSDEPAQPDSDTAAESAAARNTEPAKRPRRSTGAAAESSTPSAEAVDEVATPPKPRGRPRKSDAERQVAPPSNETDIAATPSSANDTESTPAVAGGTPEVPAEGSASGTDATSVDSPSAEAVTPMTAAQRRKEATAQRKREREEAQAQKKADAAAKKAETAARKAARDAERAEKKAQKEAEKAEKAAANASNTPRSAKKTRALAVKEAEETTTDTAEDNEAHVEGGSAQVAIDTVQDSGLAERNSSEPSEDRRDVGDDSAASVSLDAVATPNAPATPNAAVITERQTPTQKPRSKRKDKDSGICILCGQVTEHLHKDCPNLNNKAGLLKRMEERKAELAQWRREAKESGQNPGDFSEANDQGLKDIRKFYHGSDNRVSDSVHGRKSLPELGPSVYSRQAAAAEPIEVDAEDEPESSHDVVAQKQTPAKASEASPSTAVAVAAESAEPVGDSAADEAMDVDVADDAEADVPPKQLSAKSVVGKAMAKASPRAPVTPQREASADSSSSGSSQSSPSEGGEGGTPFLPQMLQMKAARRPGSRLSVSDAVIETGDSDSEDSDHSDSGSDSDSDDDSTSSDSDSDSSSAESNVNPEDLMRRIMHKPLSRTQRHRARLSLASMHPTQELSDEDIAVSDEEDDVARARATQRRDSESSIGEFEEDNNSPAPSDVEESDEDDEKRQALLSVVADRTMDADDEQDDDVETDSDGEGLALNNIANRSFTRLAERAGTSPALDDLPGDQALREVIQEDDGMEFSQNSAKESTEFNATQPIEMESIEPEVEVQREAQQTQPEPQPEPEAEPQPTPPQPKRRGRPPKAATLAARAAAQGGSEAADKEAEQPEPAASQPTRRSTRGAPANAPTSQPTPSGRTTRSSARVAASQPVTRRMTRSRSKEPEAAPVPSAKAPVSQDIAEESDAEPAVTPRSAKKKVVTYSRSRSKLKATESDADDSDSDREDNHEDVLVEPTPAQRVPSSLPPSSLPQTNGAVSSQPASSQPGKTQSSPSKRNGEDSPLFLSQPSQLPQTQAYNPHPEPLVPETQAPDSGPVRPSSPQSSPSPSPSTRGSPRPNGNGKANGKTNGKANGKAVLNGGDSDASDNEGSEKDAEFALPISLSLSQRNPAPPVLTSFPTLSSLPKELLRQGKDATVGYISRMMKDSTAGGGLPSATQQHDDSESSDDDESSSEDEVPEERRQRYAGRKKRRSTIGQQIGW